MDIKTSRSDFNGSIIITKGYCDEVFNFFKYDLNIQSDNFYNRGLYGWNWSILSTNRTLNKLKYNVYIISAYRSSPNRADFINYQRINKYFNRIIKNYKAKTNGLIGKKKQQVNKQYINRISKKLNAFIEEDIKNYKF